MTARLAAPDDAEEVVRLGARMFEEMGLPSDGPWRADAVRRVRSGLDDGSVGAFVVDDPERPGHLLASACATIAHRLPGPINRTGRAAYVQYVCTEPAARGRGLGRQVMGALLTWCAEQGAGAVELHTTADGEPLYRSLGFSDEGNPALRRRLSAPTTPAT